MNTISLALSPRFPFQICRADMVCNGAEAGQWKKEMAERCGLTMLLMFTDLNQVCFQTLFFVRHVNAIPNRILFQVKEW